MTAIAYIRGHKVVESSSDGPWRYADTGEPATEPWRPCVRCGRPAVGEVGADACLGILPGVKAACCGHGVQRAFVFFCDGTRLHPADVDVWLAIMSRREGV